jgi:superfamily I DNA/RNA helicase
MRGHTALKHSRLTPVQSKGREWPHVMIIDAHSAELPCAPPRSRRTAAAADPVADGGVDDDGAAAEALCDSATSIPEERRLLYVGQTRTQASLCIFHPTRSSSSARSGRELAPSPFLAELPAEAVVRSAAPTEPLAALHRAADTLDQVCSSLPMLGC